MIGVMIVVIIIVVVMTGLIVMTVMIAPMTGHIYDETPPPVYLSLSLQYIIIV